MQFVYCSEHKLSFDTIEPEQEVRNEIILFLPGGGKDLGKERFQYFQDKLKQKGFASASFDFTGVGESSGDLKNSSLQDRIQQTICVIKHLYDQFPEKDLALYGVSMGGYVALGAAMKTAKPPAKLVLHAPAAYAKEAHTANFGNEFTQILRRNKSWKSSQSFRWLRNYDGNTLFITGSEDEVIPTGVLKQYRQVLKGETSTEYEEVSGMKHNIWKGDSGTNYQDIILEKLFSFLKDDGSGGDK